MKPTARLLHLKVLQRSGIWKSTIFMIVWFTLGARVARYDVIEPKRERTCVRRWYLRCCDPCSAQQQDKVTRWCYSSTEWEHGLHAAVCDSKFDVGIRLCDSDQRLPRWCILRGICDRNSTGGGLRLISEGYFLITYSRVHDMLLSRNA